MKHTNGWGRVLAFALVAATATTSAQAGPGLEEKCEAAKLKVVGSYYSCRQKAEAKSALKGDEADYAKCSEKFVEKWDAATTKGGGECPDGTTGSAMAAILDADADTAADIVAGTFVAPSCGDGAVNLAGEQCDAPDFNSTTCASLGHGGGSLVCTSGCRFDASGCTVCPAGTIEYQDACWMLGDSAPTGIQMQSCDAACASLGLTCDEASLAKVSNEGTNAKCGEITDLLDSAGAPHATDSLPGGCGQPELAAIGCILYDPTLAVRNIHGSDAPTCSATNTGTCTFGNTVGKRVCACM